MDARIPKDGKPGKIRTCDPLIRSQILYPAELRVHIAKGESEIRNRLPKRQVASHGCFIIAKRMGKRQTSGVQNRNKGNLILFLLLVLLTTLGCSYFSSDVAENNSMVNDPVSTKASDGCRPTSERDISRPRITGTVVGVGDGDTITVQDADLAQHKIRFFAIDAPETQQEFGRESKSNLSSLVLRKPTCVIVIEKDQYGREVGIVFVGGEDINLAQLRAGMAWHYKTHQRKQSETDRSMYDKAEDVARLEKLGLWKAPVAVAPWDYRKLHPPRQ